MREEKVVRLQGANLAPFLSQYLVGGGIGQDEPKLEDVTIRDRRIDAICRLERYFVSPVDQTYHLSAITGTALLVQTGIVHALVLAGFDRKDVEVFLSEYQIKLTRQLTNPQQIKIQLDLTNRIPVPSRDPHTTARTFYRWQFRIEEDAWIGAMTLALPF